MSDHTPGPWVAVARTNAYIDIEAPSQHGYSARNVASTSLTNHVANARLIAAAPDLLEALQSAERAMSNRDFALMTLCGDRSVRMMIRAAIEKAEGRS